MPSSAEQYIVNKLSELVQRCGVNPVDPEIFFSYNTHPVDPAESHLDRPQYFLSRLDLDYGDDPDEPKRQKVYSLLGLDKPNRGFNSIEEALEVVENALSLAPRVRAR